VWCVVGVVWEWEWRRLLLEAGSVVRECMRRVDVWSCVVCRCGCVFGVCGGAVRSTGIGKPERPEANSAGARRRGKTQRRGAAWQLAGCTASAALRPLCPVVEVARAREECRPTNQQATELQGLLPSCCVRHVRGRV
jgi:hypothetical protein